MEKNKIPVIGFLGAGNIANAFIRGFINSLVLPEGNIIIFDNNISQYKKFDTYNIIKADSVSQLDNADYIFICVKPGHVKGAVSMLKESGISLKDKTFISVCAGVPVSFINACFGFNAAVIRTMPSTPMMVGKGAVAIARNPDVQKEKFDYVCDLISKVAVTSVLDESQLNAVIAVNGSSPAYVYLFIKAMLDGSNKLGIDEAHALPLILRTIEGAAEMVRRSDMSLDELIKEVAVPNGTTIGALEKLYEGNFENTIANAMDACTKRADEITAELIKE
ncbi:MAG: pyrroline-5-carboxylate reductase [Eubacteriales bacterium]|jgi:pyrroline-5-carboxylate reductase